MEELLKEGEAAQLLRLSVATLQSWRARKVGPSFIVLSHKAVRYRPAELEEYVKQKQVTTMK
jgi:predicted DNA-binding transcriptional regulator AlpA